VYLCLLYRDEMRRVYFTHVSSHLGFVTGIKQRLLPQLVIDHVKWRFLWAHKGTLVAGMKTCRYCEINIRDACREPVSPLSRQNKTHLFPCAFASSRLKETCAFKLRLLYLDERARSWGPPVRTGNGLLQCPLHCGHVCNGLS
jgi:hypothetical protein